MKVGHRDGGGDRKTNNPTDQCTGPIGRQDPMTPMRQRDRNGHANEPANHSPDKEASSPGSVPENGAEHRTETWQEPTSEESERWLHFSLRRRDGVFTNTMLVQKPGAGSVVITRCSDSIRAVEA